MSIPQDARPLVERVRNRNRNRICLLAGFAVTDQLVGSAYFHGEGILQAVFGQVTRSACGDPICLLLQAQWAFWHSWEDWIAHATDTFGVLRQRGKN